MNKNAYEIRLEVLSLAHGDSWNTYHEKLNVLREYDQRAMENYYRKTDLNKSTPLPELLFTAEAIDSLNPLPADIKARAAELYSFVEGN